MKGEEPLSTKIALLEQANKNNEITHQKMMENFDKLGEKVDLVKQSLDLLPKQLTDEFDKRYARKEVEVEVKEMKEKNEGRNYEWLRYLIIILVSVVATYAGVKGF